jgi:hypothetical protein
MNEIITALRKLDMLRKERDEHAYFLALTNFLALLNNNYHNLSRLSSNESEVLSKLTIQLLELDIQTNGKFDQPFPLTPGNDVS